MIKPGSSGKKNRMVLQKMLDSNSYKNIIL